MSGPSTVPAPGGRAQFLEADATERDEHVTVTLRMHINEWRKVGEFTVDAEGRFYVTVIGGAGEGAL